MLIKKKMKKSSNAFGILFLQIVNKILRSFFDTLFIAFLDILRLATSCYVLARMSLLFLQKCLKDSKTASAKLMIKVGLI